MNRLSFFTVVFVVSAVVATVVTAAVLDIQPAAIGPDPVWILVTNHYYACPNLYGQAYVTKFYWGNTWYWCNDTGAYDGARFYFPEYSGRWKLYEWNLSDPGWEVSAKAGY